MYSVRMKEKKEMIKNSGRQPCIKNKVSCKREKAGMYIYLWRKTDIWFE